MVTLMIIMMVMVTGWISDHIDNDHDDDDDDEDGHIDDNDHDDDREDLIKIKLESLCFSPLVLPLLCLQKKQIRKSPKSFQMSNKNQIIINSVKYFNY